MRIIRCVCMQGLDWFQRTLLRDSDGDCAHHFLEEPCRQQQERREHAQRRAEQQQQRRQQQAQGGQQAAGVSPVQQPAAKQQRGAVLQDSSRQAKQLAGPSDMMLDRGNVYVVPRD